MVCFSRITINPVASGLPIRVGNTVRMIPGEPVEHSIIPVILFLLVLLTFFLIQNKKRGEELKNFKNIYGGFLFHEKKTNWLRVSAKKFLLFHGR